MRACGIIVAAGAGSRLNADKNKVLLPLLGQPMFMYAVLALHPFCGRLVLVVKEEEQAAFEGALAPYALPNVMFAHGGKERRHSVENALSLAAGFDLVMIHDAARPLPSREMIQRTLDAALVSGAAVPALPIADSLRLVDEQGFSKAVPRERLFAVQTPQVFSRPLIVKAYQASAVATTDDASLVEQLGHKVELVQGDMKNIKITLKEDLAMAERLILSGIRIGTGFDTHRLVPGRDLTLCGVNVPHTLGLLGHSDADVALHALTDALLGACALGDIGAHFPDNKAEYKGISSLHLLREAVRLMAQAGFVPWQCDLTILAQKPKLAPYISSMREQVALALSLPFDRVSIKATTTEGLGFEGREEGISAQAVAQVREI